MPPIALEEHGPPVGPPLVLIHGLATTRVIWRRVVPLLERERRVVTLDVPGFGGSEPAGRGFVLEDVAARIADGLAEVGVARPYDLVGHSLGGAVALTLAAADPGDVARLVLVAPAGLRPMRHAAARVFGAAAQRAIPLRRTAAPLADLGWGRRVLMSPGTAEPATLPPAEVRAMLAASRGATRIAEALATAASSDLRPVLASLTAPVGAIWGAQDRIIPPAGVETVLGVRPGAPTETIARAGHIPMMERPEAFADALDNVLSRLGNIAAHAAV